MLGHLGDGDTTEIAVEVTQTLHSRCSYFTHIFTVYCSLRSTADISLDGKDANKIQLKLLPKEYC